jgi:hypothetical protein
VLCAFFFVYFHIYIRRRTSHENILGEYRDEVNLLKAEIDNATDRDAQLVEERIASLRKMLEDADRRISLLSRDLERRRPGTELYTSLGARQTAPGAVLEASSINHPGDGLEGGTEPPQASTAIPEYPAGEPGDAGSLFPVTETAPPARPLTERVAELSRQGISPEFIAARLGVSLSEVELALAVSRRAAAGGR